MKIIDFTNTPTDEPVQHYTFPKTKFGLILGLRGGNVVQPLGSGDWFKPPYFSSVLKFYIPLPLLPWFTIRIGKFGFYFGAKAFGVDSDAYKNWLPPEEVYDGSVAVMLCSMRFTSALQ
jgi:hypothetical protein